MCHGRNRNCHNSATDRFCNFAEIIVFIGCNRHIISTVHFEPAAAECICNNYIFADSRRSYCYSIRNCSIVRIIFCGFIKSQTIRAVYIYFNCFCISKNNLLHISLELYIKFKVKESISCSFEFIVFIAAVYVDLYFYLI